MENQILINAINEAIQKAVPSIVDEVTKKLNNTKSSRKERWENLTLDDIKKLANSSDYRDRCKAASHPKATSDILNSMGYDSDERVVTSVFRAKEKNYINSLRNIGDFTQECRYGINKKMRSIARKLLKEKLFAGEFDNEIKKNDPNHTFSFSRPILELIELTKNPEYNTAYFAKLMLEYRLSLFIKGLPVGEVQLLDYAIKNRISITQPGSNNQTVHP